LEHFKTSKDNLDMDAIKTDLDKGVYILNDDDMEILFDFEDE